jgi:hypothetical protein
MSVLRGTDSPRSYSVSLLRANPRFILPRLTAKRDQIVTIHTVLCLDTKASFQ